MKVGDWECKELAWCHGLPYGVPAVFEIWFLNSLHIHICQLCMLLFSEESNAFTSSLTIYFVQLSISRADRDN